jgi:anti-sigma regulatory factor (Ser/Thr protein kinase)
LNRDYDGEPATLRIARRDVLAWLSARGADNETMQRAALIVSELATNALQASPGHAYNVTIALVGDACAEISVRNHANGSLPPDRACWKLSDQSSLRGRGLAIVDSLSEDVAVRADSDEVVVSARIRL